MSGKIAQFMEVTGASAEQATRWIEIGGGSIDDAVMLFFESGEQAEEQRRQAPAAQGNQAAQVPPPKPLKQIPQDQDHEHKQPSATASRKSMFGFGRKTTAPQPSGYTPYYPAPKSVQSQSAAHSPESQPPKTEPKQSSNIYCPTFDYPKDGDKLFVDGGVKQGGSGTQVYAPPTDYELQIQQYNNGCLIKGQFFAFSDPQFKSIYQEMRETQSVPPGLFERFPPEQRPQRNQKINATIETHGVDYDPDKQVGNVINEQEQKKYDWDANEKGRTVGGSAAAAASSVYPVNQAVNTNFKVPGTQGGSRLKIRAKYAFVVQADLTTTVKQLLNALKANGGLPGVADVGKVVVKQMDGTVISHSQTVQQAGIDAKQIAVSW